MTYKEYMIKTLHKLYRSDEWVNELYSAISAELDKTSSQIKEDYNNLFFDSLSEVSAENFEKDLGIKPSKSQTLTERGSVIQSKWLAKSFSSLPVIQAIADSFYSAGDIVCKYSDAEIEYQVHHHLAPLDASAMVAAVDEIKPAHIGYKFTYSYITWQSYYDPFSWSEEKSRVWDSLKDESWSNQAVNKKTWSYCQNRTWEEMKTKEVE